MCWAIEVAVVIIKYLNSFGVHRIPTLNYRKVYNVQKYFVFISIRHEHNPVEQV